MKLKTIFKKPVDRSIEGVIKADDEASLRTEVEEYVITREVEKRLEAFLDAYNNYEGANGVWISGFFGSGKSHLLKMLALLLENREVEGASALEIFLTKCGENEILRGDLKKAVDIPSKSILFNIDQKADVISKTQVDALMSVFVKVFDEACGYYGKQAYIAQFERGLDRDGLFGEFKDQFQQLAGRDWEWGRVRSQRVGSHVDAAFNAVTGEDVSGILDKYRTDYRLSIEDFADQVNAYIEKQEEGFRLNFFVDEIGQYISDNTKLMTNLQTIAESLATKSRGRAWVIVTAQEDMSSVLGEMGKQQGNDFSKIQDRFKNRMKLTSADVAEVIQKRLLLKNEEGINQLEGVYRAQSNNFKTLFDFADGSQNYRNFEDRDHFIQCYPFIPFQFTLFQSAIQNLSTHNHFEGKSSSVGERSMLGVFQQVAVQICDHEIGQLATFDLMFEGIRLALKSESQHAVQVAEKNLDSDFAKRLLKALFLVKYVKEFKPTVRNLCILMYAGFDQDLPGLKKEVEEALNLLELQNYIQRTGELYEYLTNEEQDVEAEIKATEVDASVVSDALADMIFNYVIGDRKIRYIENGEDYSFTRKLDDRLHGREQELAIHVISPFHEHAEDENLLSMQSMGKDELLVIMPVDSRFRVDLTLYKQTLKYVSHTTSINQRQSVQQILIAKTAQNTEREVELRQRVKELLCKATFYAAGTKLPISGEDPTTRIQKGFFELISRTYPHLGMLRGASYREEQIGTLLHDAQGTLEGLDVSTLGEAEQEILSAIQSNARGGVRSTLKSLVEKFTRKPYGWPYAAILCTIAKLCARGKVEVRSDGNILENADIERALRNTHGQANVVLEPQVEFTAGQIRRLKEFYEDFFDAPPRATEAKALGKEVSEGVKAKIEDLLTLSGRTGEYPFVAVLNPAIETLRDVSKKPYTWHLTELANETDALLDLKEGTLDPIIRFFNGSQKSVYDAARALVQNQSPNFAYIEGDEPQQIRTTLVDPECFKGNRLQQLKGWIDAAAQKIKKTVDSEAAAAQAGLAAMRERFESMDEFAKITDEQKAALAKPFEECGLAIAEARLVAVIRDTLRQFEDGTYNGLLARMSQWAMPTQADAGESNGAGAVAEAQTSYISARSIPVSFSKAWLADESDVDEYLASMRKAYLDAVKDGKRIQI
jgi:energy-coupling factor transporter ATP-binding protein EcfA2